MLTQFKFVLFLLLSFSFAFPSFIYAQENLPSQYERGKVISILKEEVRTTNNIEQPYQKVKVEVKTGADRGRKIEIEHGARITLRDYNLVKEGDEVLLSILGEGENKEYFIADKYRLPSIAVILFAFFVLVIILSHLKGLSSILGLLVSLSILIFFIVPQIAQGADPVVVTLIGSSGIVFFSIYLAHGFNKRTTIAIISTLISLAIAVALSYVFVDFANLSGSGSEDAYALQFGPFAKINLHGLLLAGIIIGTLGVLDDITTSLSAAVDEISKANKKLSAEELYSRGLSVGREHISSLVNTLVLAYAGASMPLFLFFLSSIEYQPIWVILNNELIVEEIIRSLVGSTALVLAVPITTFIAAAAFSHKATTN